MQQESATAETGTLWLHYRQDCLRGNESIDGMTAGLKSRQCRSTGMWMTGHHHGRAGRRRDRLGGFQGGFRVLTAHRSRLGSGDATPESQNQQQDVDHRIRLSWPWRPSSCARAPSGSE